MSSRRVIIVVVLLALAGAFVAVQVENCELMDGGRHAAMTCPAAILPVPLALGLIALALMPVTMFTPQSQLVLISIYRPPRPALVR